MGPGRGRGLKPRYRLEFPQAALSKWGLLNFRRSFWGLTLNPKPQCFGRLYVERAVSFRHTPPIRSGCSMQGLSRKVSVCRIWSAGRSTSEIDPQQSGTINPKALKP